MTSVRLLRLQSDYEAVRRLARLHPRIAVEGVSGNPPDRYRLVLKVKSLRENVPSSRLPLSHTGMCGVMPALTSQPRSFPVP